MASEYYRRRLTDEQRQAKSELAKKMHEEVVIDPVTGQERRKFGGPQPRSGRPRKPRPTEVMAALASDQGIAYFQRLDDIAINHPSANASIAAIKEILGIVETERRIEQQEQERLERLQRDELIFIAVELLEKTGIISDPNTVDGEIAWEEDGGYPELSAGSQDIEPE